MKLFVIVFCTLNGILLSSGAAVEPLPQGRIVGGDDAVLGQVPYQAAFFIAGEPTCGAVILSERYALTHIQCVCSKGSNTPWPPQLFTIAAGTTDLYTGGQRIRIEEIIVNTDYNSYNTGIALLKLSEPLTLSDDVQPIRMAREMPPLGASVEISGWGRTKEGEKQPTRSLQINEVEVVDSRQCSQELGEVNVNDQLLCLGHLRKNGICLGDFGGPAVYEGELVGIASNVLGECGSLLPDAFISVPSYYEWIAGHTIEQ